VWPRRAGPRNRGSREWRVGRRGEHRGEGCGEIGAGWGVEPEGVVVLTGVAALDAEAVVRTCGWDPAMSRTGTKAQDARARARARAARLLLLADRNAQDKRIEDGVAAVLLVWQKRSSAQAQVEKAERAAGAGLRVLGREKVPVRDMAALTRIGQAVCSRLLKMPAIDQPANGTGGPDAAG